MTDTLQGRAAVLRDQGLRTAYAIGYATVSNPDEATHLHIWLGEQWSGKRLYMVDLDSHKGQNADAALAAFQAARPELAAKLDFYPSKHGGFHALFESSVQIPTGKLYDQANNHIGELLGKDTDRTLDPGDVQIPILHAGEIDRLLNVWHIKGSDPKGERWADRAKQGANWTRGYNRIRVTKIELRAHLKRNCGPAGTTADLLFDQKEPFDRSAKFGNLVQTLMLHAHKLPGQQNTGFVERCTAVMAYTMASDAYGKAGEKGYSFEKDAASLIAQIVNGDPYGDGRRWIIPFWAKSHATAAPAPQPAPAAPRAAHRPAGDRARQITRLKRFLKHRWEDETTGRFYYFVDDLDDWAARCGVSRRSIQSYLTDLEKDDQIERGQEGGRGGRPWMLIKERFFGMQITQETAPKAVPEPDKIAAFWDADPSADQGILTPQTAASTPVCIVDHQNTGVPTHQPARAPQALEDLVARDMAILQDLYADLRPLTPEERAKTRKPKQKRFIPRKGQRVDLRYSAHHGAAPVPTPYRPRAALPIETLPEPPAAAVPAGTHGAGAPLSGPQAGPTPAQLMAERRRRLEAMQALQL